MVSAPFFVRHAAHTDVASAVSIADRGACRRVPSSQGSAMARLHSLSSRFGALALTLALPLTAAARTDVPFDEPQPPATTIPSTRSFAPASTTPSPGAPTFAPRWTGNTLFATSALTASVSLGLHALAAKAVQDNCRLVENPSDLLPSEARDLGIGDVLDSTFLSNIDVICSPKIALAGAARLLVPVFSAGAIAQVAVGGALAGDREAFDDTLSPGRRHKAAVMMGLGGVLLAGGAVLWAGSRASMFENRTGCDSITCLAWYDFGTVQGSALLAMAGSGMLAHGVAYRAGRRRYGPSELGVTPVISRRQAGLAISARF
jgi:hypothetical protein